MILDTLAKQLIFSTVRIKATKADGKQTIGTGFMFNCSESKDDPKETIALLVSNKHIIETAVTLEFDFLMRNADNSGPHLSDPPRKHLITGAALPNVYGHPDPEVDVAVMPFNDVILALPENERPFIRMLNWWHIPSPATLNSLDVIEELTFVGYPDGWIDSVHGTPIVRQAITATPLMLPFEGRPAFLVDGSVFGGSSGSPVFILNRGSWTGPQGLVLGDRMMLVGVIASTAVREDELPIQVAKAPFVQISQELDLGYAFSTQAILETVNHLLTVAGRQTMQGLA